MHETRKDEMSALGEIPFGHYYGGIDTTPLFVVLVAIGGTDLHGTVDSFSPGTGSQFALLPPQNATGNFTKIVQRVPVRIHVDMGQETRKVLVPGLSVTVNVDTRSRVRG